MNRATFETALDAGNLQTRVILRDGDRWYDCRRNGRTQTWKRDPARFEIPVKFRLKDTMRVTSDHFNRGEVDRWFRVRPLEVARAEFVEPPVHTTDMED